MTADGSAFLTPFRLLTIVGLMGVSFAGGYFLSSSPEQEVVIADQATKTEEGRKRQTVTVLPLGPGVKVPRSSDEVFQMAGQIDRTAQLLLFYENLDPAQFAEEARKLEDLPWSDRIFASYLLFSQWGEEDPQAAMAFADTMGFGGRFVKPTVLQSWAGDSPEQAAQYFIDNPLEFRTGRRGDSAAAGVAKEWARQDPEAALAWANGLEGDDKASAVRGVFGQLAQTDPGKASEFLTQYPDLPDRGRLIETIGRNYGQSDFAAGEAWANNLTGEDRDRALSDVISGLAINDPELAGDKALAMAEGSFRDEALGRTAQEFSREYPEQALDFLLANASAEGQSRYVGEVISNLTRKNDQAARDFVLGQQGGALRDEAAAYYVASNTNSNFQAVLEIANSIQDEDRRRRSLGRAARQGMVTSPEAARGFVENSEELSDRQKRRLLN